MALIVQQRKSFFMVNSISLNSYLAHPEKLVNHRAWSFERAGRATQPGFLSYGIGKSFVRGPVRSIPDGEELSGNPRIIGWVRPGGS
jgi:hypothetical protein